jgi:3-oxoacyl-[acyl-carrier-protein] synthase-3
MGSKITNIETYFPKSFITNEQLVTLGNTSLTPDKILKKLGISKRYVVSENETSLDLAYNAGEKVLENIDRASIDFLILCTQSPDYYLPTSACILQDRLKLNKNIGAFDFNLGCSGYVYGLAIAKGLIAGGIAKKILLITAETYTKMLHPNDISNRSIFGDGAAASVIEYSSDENIYEFSLGTDGAGYDNLIVKNGCFRTPYKNDTFITTDDSGNVRSDNNLFMNGPEIFNFTISSIPSLVLTNAEKNNINLDEIDYFIFHQANKYMLEYLRNKIKIQPDKFYINLENTGNTVSSTIPIALKEVLNLNIIKRGSKVMLCGFGVGYSWGATIINL